MDNNENYKVSAIVLVYNGEKYLEDCIDSLVNQTIDNMEIILVNDASTDDSLSICKKYAADYEYIKIIDKKVNEGLAITGNTGISAAKGEYIILVDNDDIIPPYAYERLYNKAKETNADIVTGKANFLIGDYQYLMDNYELSVWEKERTIGSAKEFSTIFHDAFYWNKIIRRKLILENEIRLPKDMIYADRKFVHLCFIHAKIISIIPDCVYLWRQRNSGEDTSLSMKRRETSNYINRIDSYEQDLDKFTSFDENYFKVIMRRILVPIMGILESEDFKEVFFERAYKLLSKEAEKYEDIYDNELDIQLNLYIYLILHDFKEELINLLKDNIELEKDIIQDDGKNYWNLSLFRNSKIKIPDRFFEIKSLRRFFVNFDDIVIEDEFITFNKIVIPKNMPIKTAKVLFIGKTTEDEVLDDNKLSFELNVINGEEIPFEFTAKVPSKGLNSVEEYDIFFEFEYSNDKSDIFRITKNNFKEIINNSRHLSGYITSNYLLIRTLMLNDAFKIEPNQKSLNLKVNDGVTIKKPLEIYIQNRRSNEIVYLTSVKNELFKIEWEYFLDKGSDYDFYLKFNKKSRLNVRSISNFEDISFQYENINIKIYKTDKGNIALKS